MLTTNEFLDAVKKKHGIASDYKLGQFLELSDNAVGHYRKGRSLLDTSVAIKVADALGVDPAFVVACVEHERAERSGKEREATMWKIVAKKFVAAARKLDKAAAIFIAAVLSMFISGGPDGGAMAAEPSTPGATHCATPSPAASIPGTSLALCQMVHGFTRWLARALFPRSFWHSMAAAA